MKRPSRVQPPDLWLVDGSLRDVYVFQTKDMDWRRLLELASSYDHRYLLDGDQRTLPRCIDVFEDRQHRHLLEITAGGARINCHFFVHDEIELDIDPREITSDQVHHEVLAFLEQLSRHCSKPVVLTPENAPDLPLLTYDPNADKWLWT